MLLKYIFIYFIGTIITFVSTVIGYYLFNKSDAIIRFSQQRSFLHIILSSSLIYAIVFSIMKDLTVLSHHSYADFAVYLEIFNNFANGKGLFCSIQENFVQGTGNWLSAHFTPIAYIFAYLFKIWPSFRMINWTQTVFLGSSSLILYFLTRHKIGEFSSFCVSMALLLNPTFQYITLYEFEFFRFIIPIGILTVGIILTKESVLWILLASLATLLIREDAAFFVFGIGLYIVFFQKKRLLGASIISFSIIYLMVMLKIIMPLFRSGANNMHVAANFFSALNNTPVEIIKNVILHPIKFLIHILHPYKSINYFMYLLPFSFIPLFGIKVLIIALPTAVFLAFSSSSSHSSYFLYYVSPIIVSVVWATVIGIEKLTDILNTNIRLQSLLKIEPRVTKKRIAFAVLCGSIVSSIYFGPFPLSIQFWNRNFSLAPFRTHTFNIIRYQARPHDETIRKVARLIPHNAFVSTEQSLMQEVYKSKSIYVFPYIEFAEYIFIDKKNPIKTGIANVPGSWYGLRQNPQFYYNWVEKRPDIFELVTSEDGIFLYKRKANAPSYPQPFEVPSGIRISKEDMERALADHQRRMSMGK